MKYNVRIYFINNNSRWYLVFSNGSITKQLYSTNIEKSIAGYIVERFEQLPLEGMSISDIKWEVI